MRYGASPRMPELHGSLVEMAQSVQPLHLHKWHELLPVHEGSHSSHFVSCARPEEQARKPWQKSQSLHLHVSQCEPLSVSLQCACRVASELGWGHGMLKAAPPGVSDDDALELEGAAAAAGTRNEDLDQAPAEVH